MAEKDRWGEMSFEERNDFHSATELRKRNEERRREREAGRAREFVRNLVHIHEAYPDNQGRDGIDLGITGFGGSDAQATEYETIELYYVKNDNTVGLATFVVEEVTV